MRLRSTIESVTVFGTGAEVCRRVEIPSEGLQLPATVVLPGLPLCLLDSSISAGLDHSGGPNLSVVEARALVELDPELPAQITELAELSENLDSARRDLANAQFWLGLLAQLSIPGRPEGKKGEAPPPLAVESRLQILDFREAMTEQWTAEEGQHRVRVENLEERLKALTSEKSERTPVSKAVLIRLDGEGRLQDESVLRFTYRVPGARWAPSYTLNFDSDLSAVKIHLRAMVCQQTGEDWTNAKLSFSSSEPQSMQTRPVLKSVRIGKEQPSPPPSSWKAPPRDTEALFQDFDHKRTSGVQNRPQPPVSAAALSTGQKLALLMMSLSPEASAQLFAELEPEVVQALCLEITKIPSFSSSLREEVLHEARNMTIPPDDTFEHAVVRALCYGFGRATAPGAGGAFDELDHEDSFGTPLRSASIEAVPAAGMKSEDAAVRRRVAPEKKMKLRELAPPGDGGGSAPPEPRKPEPLLEVAPEARDYARLVMRGPYESDRGTLRHQSLLEQVLAEANRVGASVDGLAEQVEDCIRRARMVDEGPLPAGCVKPAWPGNEPFDLYIEATDPATVAADGAFHSLALQTIKPACKAHFITVPRETLEVFRSVELSSERALPEGPSDIYVGQNYLLSGPFRGTAPGGKLRLALGVEERLDVVRNTRFEESSSGMVSKTRNLVHNIEIELHNGLGRMATIEVRERIPQPGELEKDIDITVNNAEPEWEPFEPEEQPGFSGAYRWWVDLEPRARCRLRAGYTVSLPYKYELDGGNRRE